jgi:lysyl-tRNA synthetase class 2
MILTTVRSNAIHAIGYDRENQLMEIIFNNGGIYCYAHVPQHLFEGFLSSPSKGEFFQSHIRGAYPNWRLGRWRKRFKRAA